MIEQSGKAAGLVFRLIAIGTYVGVIALIMGLIWTLFGMTPVLIFLAVVGLVAWSGFAQKYAAKHKQQG